MNRPGLSSVCAASDGSQIESFPVRVRHLFISPVHNYFGHHGLKPGTNPTLEVREVECVAGRGVRGDRFFDYRKSNRGQITFFAMETYRALCRELRVWNKSPLVFRRNVITEGADLNALIGGEFELQGIRFRGTEECKPCYWMDDAFGPGAERQLAGRGGLRAMILNGGILSVDSL